MSEWLHIIGIGDDGISGLSSEALVALGKSDVIIGGKRHHELSKDIVAERLAWPSPFDAMIKTIKEYNGKQVVVLVSGDPLWYSAGATFVGEFSVDEMKTYPQVSAYQWASVRMGWSLADCDALTIHGRPIEQIVPYIAPNVQLLILTKDKSSPRAVADQLVERGFGKSELTVLAHLGGKKEERFDGLAQDWEHEVPDFHTLAVKCIAGKGAKYYGRTGGLPDNAFEHDGQLTKRIVRTASVSQLRPYQDALLWDVGAGCGSVAIEWMRGARGAQAIAIEANEERNAMMEKNALILGVPNLQQVKGSAPQALQDLPAPDAIFIGGGITSESLFETAWHNLREGGRLVANAVTLESEATLISLHAKYGGSLDTIAVSEAVGVGRFNAMKPYMSVMQWAVSKPYASGA